MDPHSSSYTSLPILAVSVVGILATAILLLSYYLFIINCCLHWRRRRGARADLLPFRGVRRRAEPARVAPPHDPHEVARGLDPAAIRSIPTLRFAGAAAGKSPRGPADECAVCLADFEERELLRVLPGCGHSFHVDCIDTWLQYSSAMCPLCRLDVSRVQPTIHSFVFPDSEGDSGAAAVAVEAATDNTGCNAGSAAAATELAHTPIRRSAPRVSKQNKLWQVASMGDECIDISRGKDERFAVQQPIRRSFSMDSSNDRPLFLSVQETLQRNREVLLDIRRGEGSSGGSGNASGRIRRSFFSFGRSSRSTTAVVLPVVQSDLC